MLDMARTKLAAGGSPSSHAAASSPMPSPIVSQEVAPARHISYLGLDQAVYTSAAPSPSNTAADLTSNGVNVDEVSDNGVDYIDILLQNDDWFNDEESNNEVATAVQPPTSFRPQVIIPPITTSLNTGISSQNLLPQESTTRSSKNVATSESKSSAPLDRREKNRIAARKSRMKKKLREQELQQKADFYTRCKSVVDT